MKTTLFEPDEARAVRRLHPVSLLFGLAAHVRNLLLPGIVVLFASRGGDYELWAMVLFVPAVFSSLLRYWSYRYWLGTEELVIREGVLSRNERHIPYSRIQNIDRIQNPLHRVFGVAMVRLQTAGGSEPEADIRVLSLDAVDELRRRALPLADRELVAGTSDGQEPPSPSRTLHHSSLRELAVYGLIANQGMALVAAGFGLVWQSGLVEDPEAWLQARAQESMDQLQIQVPEDSLFMSGLLLFALLLVLVLLLRVLSVVWAILRLYDFRLTSRGEDLRSEYGLLTRVSATIPRNRIQLLSTTETPIHRWFSAVSLRAQTAGSGSPGKGGSGVTESPWLAPLISRDRLAALVGAALPEIALDEVRWRPVPGRAWRRVFVKAVLFLLGIAGMAGLVLGPVGLIVLPLGLVPALLHARALIRHTAYAVSENAIFYRTGWWTRRSGLVRFEKIQSLSLTESPFDRRHLMATLGVDTAGGSPMGLRLQLAYLDVEVALRLMRELYRETDRSAFRW